MLRYAMYTYVVHYVYASYRLLEIRSVLLDTL